MGKVRRISDSKVLGEFAELCFTTKATSLGLVVAKPYGDSMPYDVIVDNGACLKVQVKSTARMHFGGYSVRTSRTRGGGIYKVSETNFLAAYVVPENVWYLIPIGAIKRRQMIRLFPHIQDSDSRWEKYREAWHLLLPKPLPRRIFAQADTGADDDLSEVFDEGQDINASVEPVLGAI